MIQNLKDNYSQRAVRYFLYENMCSINSKIDIFERVIEKKPPIVVELFQEDQLLIDAYEKKDYRKSQTTSARAVSGASVFQFFTELVRTFRITGPERADLVRFLTPAISFWTTYKDAKLNNG